MGVVVRMGAAADKSRSNAVRLDAVHGMSAVAPREVAQGVAVAAQSPVGRRAAGSPADYRRYCTDWSAQRKSASEAAMPDLDAWPGCQTRLLLEVVTPGRVA